MTIKSATDRVLSWVASGQRHYVNICTADTMVQCFDQPQLAKIVNDAGMATTDGMPLVWLAHHYGFKAATRVYGPDLMLELCRSTAESLKPLNVEAVKNEKGDFNEPSGRLNGLNESESRFNTGGSRPVSHFFYGATDEVLAQLKSNLLKKFPDLQIAGMYSPPFRPLTETEKDEVAERINASGADIVWCGLGTPKQDYWVAEFRPRLNCAAILAVGAAFNFHAGHVRQAPRWMMRSGLEWLFRLGVEPKRLWRRYLIGNPRFVCLTAGRLIRDRRNRDRRVGE
jgi:N-acetylglucosaminyldiphosphoundecaprenol N-acetyl-beta-D-mannosaminyltransferase